MKILERRWQGTCACGEDKVRTVDGWRDKVRAVRVERYGGFYGTFFEKKNYRHYSSPKVLVLYFLSRGDAKRCICADL